MVFAAVVPAKSCVEWNYWRILFFCSSVWFFNLHFYVSSWRVFYTHAYAGIFHCNENKDFSFVLLSAKSSEAIFLRLSSVGHFLRWNNWATALFVKKKKKSFHCRRTWEDRSLHTIPFLVSRLPLLFDAPENLGLYIINPLIVFFFLILFSSCHELKKNKLIQPPTQWLSLLNWTPSRRSAETPMPAPPLFWSQKVIWT